jgi:hypothetical protein
MRSVTLISILRLSVAIDWNNASAPCVADNVAAFGHLTQLGISLKDSIDKCQKNNDIASCVHDIADVIKDGAGMLDDIMEALTDCGLPGTLGKSCTVQISEMSEGLAGLTAASSSIYTHCAKEFQASQGDARRLEGGEGGEGGEEGGEDFTNKCVLSLTPIAENLLETIRTIMEAYLTAHNCDHGAQNCAALVVDAVARTSGIVKSVAVAIVGCAKGIGWEAPCTVAVSALVEHTSAVTEASILVVDACTQPPARLYDAKVPSVQVGQAGQGSYLFSVSLPVTAMVGFIGFLGGFAVANRRARSRETRGFENAPAEETLSWELQSLEQAQ